HRHPPPRRARHPSCETFTGRRLVPSSAAEAAASYIAVGNRRSSNFPEDVQKCRKKLDRVAVGINDWMPNAAPNLRGLGFTHACRSGSYYRLRVPSRNGRSYDPALAKRNHPYTRQSLEEDPGPREFARAVLWAYYRVAPARKAIVDPGEGDYL